MRILSALLALALLLFPAVAGALEPNRAFHQYVRNSWSVQQGLLQISALSIAQDRDGYLWVGTQVGLARFDGVRFVSFQSDTEPGLPGGSVRTLHTSRDGRLWIGTYKGLAVYDGVGFVSVPAADAERSPTLDVFDLTQDEAGTIWAATTTGLFHVQGGRLHAAVGSPSPLRAVLARRDGVWVGTIGAVHRRTARGWHAMPLPDAAVSAPVNRLLEVQGDVWAATGHGLYLLGKTGWQPLQDAPQLAQVAITLLYADGDGNLWAGSDTGLARIRGGRLLEYIDAEAPGGIAGLRAALEDREGNVWFGSQWQSLIRVSNSWVERFGVTDGLNNPIVWSVSPDPDGRRIWIGTNDGVSVLEEGRFTLVAPGSKLPGAAVNDLLAERDRLWLGTAAGVAVIDHTGPSAGIVRTPKVLAPLAAVWINSIMREADGLWLASTEGLYHLTDTASGQQLRRYAQADGLLDPRVRVLLRTREGRMVVGSQGGLFELRGERFVPLGTDTGLPRGLDITAIRQLEDGNLLIGSVTEQAYLNHGDRWIPLGEAQGLPTNTVTSMVEHAGQLWLAGIRGVSRVPVNDLKAFASGRIDRVRGEMLLSDRGDPRSGQSGYCCNGGGNNKGFLRGDVYWLPSRDGVVAVHSDAIKLNQVPPPVVIERAQVDDEWQPARSLQAPELPASARDLEFEFTVLSLRDPRSVRVQYRMLGYDRDWRDADPLNRNARYTNLPPGNYVFEVRGENNAAVPSANPARWPFSIQPRFHETGWFLALLGLALAALAYAGYRYQRRRYRLQRDVLNALVLERTEALEHSNARLSQVNDHLEEASQSDLLTGLRNRRYMVSQIPLDLSYYDRQVVHGEHRDEVIVFALLDIDHFKSVNDLHGHRVGDLVLQQFAQVLNELVRNGDYVVRWGGEEFLVVFRPMPSRNLDILGNRLREAVSQRVFDIGDEHSLRLTASIGLAEYPKFGGQLGWEAMVELADQAMYYVKTHGRDGWAAFRPTSTTDPDTLLQELRQDHSTMLAQGRLQLLGSRATSGVAVDDTCTLG